MAAAASRSWKLYHNHHFLLDSCNDYPHLLISYQSTSIPTHSDPTFADMVATDHNDLTLALAEIDKLRHELDLERRMRHAAESLAKSIARDLAEERRARADSDAKAAHCLNPAGRSFRELGGKGVDCVVAVRNGREMRGGEVENPHIKRGIKGLVEFSRAFRVRLPGSGRERERAGGNLECQRARLKVLLKQRCTADLRMTAAAQNLV